MPFAQRTVVPGDINRVRVPQNTSREFDELEFVENGALAGLVRQLQSLSALAADLFDRLTDNVAAMHGRLTRVTERVDSLAYAASKLDVNNDERTQLTHLAPGWGGWEGAGGGM